jgi:hypothetical protein
VPAGPFEHGRGHSCAGRRVGEPPWAIRWFRGALVSDQAREAMQTVVDYLTSKLLASIASRINGMLGGQSMGGAAHQAQQVLGGLGNPFGKKSD